MRVLQHCATSRRKGYLRIIRGETYTRLPEVVRLVQFSLNLDECCDKDAQAELLHLMFYVVDKVWSRLVPYEFLNDQLLVIGA